MTKPYIELIDEQIAVHERALAELAIARSVVLSLTPKEPKGNKSGSSAKRVTQKKSKGYVAEGIMRAMTMLAAENLEGSTSKQIWEGTQRLDLTDLTQKRVWNTLYVLVSKRLVVKDGSLYRLPIVAEARKESA